MIPFQKPKPRNPSEIPPEVLRSIQGLGEYADAVDVPASQSETDYTEPPVQVVRFAWFQGWFDSHLPYSGLAIGSLKVVFYFQHATFPAAIFQTGASITLPILILLAVHRRKFRAFQILVSLLMVLSIASVLIPSPVAKP